MPDLLSRQVDPTGIMSLLTPFVSGGAIPAPPPDAMPDPQAQAMAANAATPAWLAFAQTLGQAGTPRYGPAPALGPAIVGAMGAGYSTAQQAKMLPFMSEEAGLSLQQRELALQQQQFEFSRQQDMWNAARGFLMGGGPVSAALPPPGQGAPVVNALTAPPATTEQLAQVPELAAIKDPSIRARMILYGNQMGMSLPAFSRYASMINTESGGEQWNKDGTVKTSPAGAVGVAQVVPATFKTVSQQYPDVGTDINDPYVNLKAGMRYYMQGLHAANGDVAGAAAYYNGGPKGLTGYQSGNTDPKVADYISQTGGFPGGQGGGASSAMGPMVSTPWGTVPQVVAQEARNAFAGGAFSGDISKSWAAANDIVTKWQQGQWQPVGGGNVQVNPYTGETKAASTQPNTQPMSAADRQAYFPDAPSNVGAYWEIDASGKRTPTLAGGARGSQQLYGRITEQNEAINNSAPMKQLQQAETYSRGVINALNSNSGPGDIAAMDALFRVYDPTAVTTEAKMEAAGRMGGYAQEIQQWLARVQGGDVSALPPLTRQQIVELLTSEMKSREGQVGQYIKMQRGNYAGSADEAAQIGKGWAPQYITAGDDEFGDLPPGTAPTTSGWIPTPNASGQLTWRRGRLGAPPSQPVTTPQPTVTPTPQPTAPQPTAPKPQPLTDTEQAQLDGMSVGGLQKLKASPEYRSDPALKTAVDAALKAKGA